MTVEIEKVSLKSLTRYQVIGIPSYQRDFDWSVPQFEMLWTDLTTHMANGGEYFMGPLNAEKLQFGDGIDVADGQQRLTSLMILLAVLKCLLKKKDPEIDNIDSLLFVDEGASPRKLRLQDKTPEGKSNLQEALERTAPFKDRLTSKHRIAFNYFYEQAVGLQKTARKKKVLATLAKLVLSDVVFAIVVAQEVGMGVRMFERSNTRGRALTFTDNLKSLLIAQSRKEDSSDVIANWSTAIASLREVGRYNDRTLLNWLSSDYECDDTLRVSKALSFAREMIRTDGSLKCSEKLVSYSTAVNRIAKGLTPGKAIRCGSLENLRLFQQFKQLPTILPAARKLPEEQFVKLAEAVENTVCVVAVAGAFPPEIEREIPKLLQHLKGSPDLGKLILDLRTIRNSYSQKFGDILLNETYPPFKRITLIALWDLMEQQMARLNQRGKQAPRKATNVQTYSVEHILAEASSAKDAIKEFGDGAPFDRYRVGNMTPLESGKNYGTLPYSKKKNDYADSKFELTRSMATLPAGLKKYREARNKFLPVFGAWNHDLLNTRARNLYSLASRALDFDESDDITEAKPQLPMFKDSYALPREQSFEILARELLSFKNDAAVDRRHRSTLRFLELIEDSDGEEQLSDIGEKLVNMSESDRAAEMRTVAMNMPYVQMWADLDVESRKRSLERNVLELRDVKSRIIVGQITDCLNAWVGETHSE